MARTLALLLIGVLLGAKELIGQELQALPYPLVYNLLENRIVENEKKKYHLKVEAVIIAETVVYYLRVKKITEEVVAMTELNVLTSLAFSQWPASAGFATLA
ncbi:MAG: hypothetical protein AB1796_12040 [Bacillota bacterium]